MKIEKKNKLIDTARAIFLRYGYKRVTMHDIAEAAGMSRPAVYLMFPGKEEIFRAVMEKTAFQSLAEISKGLRDLSSPEEKLMYAFEIWTIRPFDLILSSPDAKELLDCIHEFSKDVYEKAGAAFEGELVKVLKPLMKPSAPGVPSATTVARILRNAARGFKVASKNSAELRGMMKNLIEIIIYAVLLPAPKQTKKRTSKK